MLASQTTDSPIQLRDLVSGDIADYQRWYTTELEWAQWDAPWEAVDEAFAINKINQLKTRSQNPPPDLRTRLEIYSRDTHIGWVTCYYIEQDISRLAVGICIPETAFWGKGAGTAALKQWEQYLFEHWKVEKLYCETWSGNERMVRLALKVGFEIIENDRTIVVNDILYQRLRFRISKEHI